MQEAFIAVLELCPSDDEVDLFFCRFDSNHDGLLNFGDFCSVFLPVDSQVASLLNQRKSARRNEVGNRMHPRNLFLPQTLLDIQEVLRA
jgi:hypothetical protein